MKQVIVSNGFHKFPMANAAAELHSRGLLAELVTGPYPTGRAVRVMNWLGPLAGPRRARLLDRRAALPDDKVRAIWWPEAVEKTAATIRHTGRGERVAASLESRAYAAYGSVARASVKRFRTAANVYHYRAGFGHASVAEARRLGMLTVCDCSAAHPALFQYLREHGGQFLPPGQQGPMTRFWSDILRDIDRSETVMVNSDFVRDTFVHQGWDPVRIVRVYPGVDEQFFGSIPARAPRNLEGPVQMLFAGLFDAPKGAAVLLHALRSIPGDEWRLTIVGPVASPISREFADVLDDPRVRLTGLVRRGEVARLMSETDIFVFPSLAEGSARVVYEALASGCYVITTSHSADLVEGEHGAIVPPGDAAAVASAIRNAIANRPMVAEIGARNAALIRDHYRQRHYGEQLIEAYETLLDRRAAGRLGSGAR